MKKLYALMAVTVLALPASTQKCGSSTDAVSEWNCNCTCPLAEQANTRRTFGFEAVATSAVARAEFADVLELNLARI